MTLVSGLDVTKLYANSVSGESPIQGVMTEEGGCVIANPTGQACDLKVSNAERIGSYLHGSILGKSFGNPLWFDLRYNNVVRVEYQKLTSTSWKNDNEGWALLTSDIFNLAQNSRLPLLCRLITCGAVTTNAIPWSTMSFNRVFILGDTFVTTNTHDTRYRERIKAYISDLQKPNVVTDVKKITIGSEYLCDDSMIFVGKNPRYATISPTGKRAHSTASRFSRLHGGSATVVPARLWKLRQASARATRGADPTALINPDTGLPYGSSR